MKLSRKIISVVLLTFAITPTLAQTVNPAKLKINGTIGLDSTYTQVVKALGKPFKETRP
jgi:hypothetical protein